MHSQLPLRQGPKFDCRAIDNLQKSSPFQPLRPTFEFCCRLPLRLWCFLSQEWPSSWLGLVNLQRKVYQSISWKLAPLLSFQSWFRICGFDLYLSICSAKCILKLWLPLASSKLVSTSLCEFDLTRFSLRGGQVRYWSCKYQRTCNTAEDCFLHSWCRQASSRNRAQISIGNCPFQESFLR